MYTLYIYYIYINIYFFSHPGTIMLRPAFAKLTDRNPQLNPTMKSIRDIRHSNINISQVS